MTRFLDGSLRDTRCGLTDLRVLDHIVLGRLLMIHSRWWSILLLLLCLSLACDQERDVATRRRDQIGDLFALETVRFRAVDLQHDVVFLQARLIGRRTGVHVRDYWSFNLNQNIHLFVYKKERQNLDNLPD